jgi:class 3 adenylate cyclase
MPKSWFIEFMNAPPQVSEKRRVLKRDALTVGRISSADIVIDWDKKISRMHAKLAPDGNGIMLTDLNSTNGTFLADEYEINRVDGSVRIPSPSVVKFGDTVVSVGYGAFSDGQSVALTKSLLLSLPEAIDNKRMLESILVLDQCESSTLAGAEGDETAFHLKKRMFQLCGSVFKDHKPNYMKNTGDGFLATFSEAGVCYNAARAIIKLIQYRNKATHNLLIHVRIGIHSGETYYMDVGNMDRHGNDVNIAFRIEGVKADAFLGGAKVPLPEKDRIIVSKPFLDELKKDRESLTLLGHADLKGIKESVELFLYTQPLERF